MIRLTSPTILNDNSFEYLVSALPSPDKLPQEEVQLDLTLTEAIDPFSLLGIVTLGNYLKRSGSNTRLLLPRHKESLSFMEQAGLNDYLPVLFNEHTPLPDDQVQSDKRCIVGITKIEKSLDIHDIVIQVRERLGETMNSSHNDIWNSSMVIISEMCQNIHEHSMDTGFALIVLYRDHYKRDILHLVIMDTGIGIKTSLDQKFHSVFREKWSDYMALHKTLFEGVSRHDDPGRGNGIVRSKELVNKFNGKMSIRSGTAKLWGRIPAWEIERFFRKPLTYLPGTQINILLPLNSAQ